MSNLSSSSIAINVTDRLVNTLQGHLKIRGIFSYWTKYWFVLHDTTLLRFKHSTSTTSEEEIELSAPGVQVVNAEGLSGKKNTIGIFLQGKSPYILLASSESEQLKWIEALKACTLNASPAVSSYSGASPSQHGDSANDKIVELLEAIIDACVITDEKCNILGFNKAAEQMFAYRKVDVVGKNVTVLMPPSYARFHDKFITAYFQSGHKKLIGIPRGLLAQKKDGNTFPIQISLGEVPQHKTGETKCAFMAIFRYMDEKASGTSSSPSTPEMEAPRPSLSGFGSGNSSSGFSVSSSKSKLSKRRDSESSGDDSEHSSSNSGNQSEGNEHFIALAQDMATGLKYSQLKFQGKMNDFIDDMKSMLQTEYEDIEKRFISAQNKVTILEQENKRLVSEIERQNKLYKQFSDELSTLQKSSEVYGLLKVMRNTAGYQAFFSFCKQEGCTELLTFWKDAEDYRAKHSDAFTANAELMQKEAQTIIDKYLEPSSVYELDVCEVYLKLIKQALVSGNCGPNLFAAVQKEVLRSLLFPVFKKFCETGTGKAVLEPSSQ